MILGHRPIFLFCAVALTVAVAVLQTGYLTSYAFVMVVGLAGLVTWLWLYP